MIATQWDRDMRFCTSPAYTVNQQNFACDLISRFWQICKIKMCKLYGRLYCFRDKLNFENRTIKLIRALDLHSFLWSNIFVWKDPEVPKCEIKMWEIQENWKNAKFYCSEMIDFFIFTLSYHFEWNIYCVNLLNSFCMYVDTHKKQGEGALIGGDALNREFTVLVLCFLDKMN